MRSSHSIRSVILFLGLVPLATLAVGLPEEFTLPSPWIKSLEARLWSGYKDNVLLGNRNAVESGFSAAGGDLTCYRVPLNGWEYVFLGSAEFLQYWDATQVNHEANVVMQGHLRKSFREGWKAGLSADYLYFNQVFDASAFEDELRAIPVEAHAVTVTPALSKQVNPGLRIELGTAGTRQLFREFIDDYWEFGPRLTLDKAVGNQAGLTFSYQFLNRLHDTRQARDVTGQSRQDQRLEFLQHEISGTWRQIWDEARRWRTVTRVSLRHNQDNGGGFYEYWRPQFSEQIRFQALSWELKAEARVTYYHYERERIAPLNSAGREKTYLNLNLRAEHSFNKWLKVFAQYEYERALSNLQVDAYEVNTYSAGIDCEF